MSASTMTERSFLRGASDSEYTLAPSGQRRSNVDKVREWRSPPSSRSRNTGAREAFQSQMGFAKDGPEALGRDAEACTSTDPGEGLDQPLIMHNW